MKKHRFAALTAFFLGLTSLFLCVIPGTFVTEVLEMLSDITRRAIERKHFKCPHCENDITYGDGMTEGGACPHCGTTL